VGIDYVFVGERSDMNVDNNGRDIIMPMLSMSIPLYRKKYDAHTKETQLKQKAIANYKANTENSLLSKYEMAWYELEKAKTLISLYKTQVVKTQKVISLLETAYSNSGQEFEEVLRFQQELLQYQIAETTAIKSFYIALAKLDYLTSK
jgi:outer membrane protein TolC